MRTVARTTFFASLALLGVAVGCRQADRAISTPPSRAELPTFTRPEPKLSAVVGVEGARDLPRVASVPRYEEIKLTPEEREALGEREVPEPDALLFYRPPRGPEHGVSPELFPMSIGVSGIGGALIGRETAYPRYGVHGLAGHYAAEHGLARFGAGVGLSRGPTAAAARGWGVQVGEGLARKGAARASRVDR
jgi:hypothetical protein